MVTFLDFLAGMIADAMDAITATPADNAIKFQFRSKGMTGVPSGFNANVENAQDKPKPRPIPTIAPPNPSKNPCIMKMEDAVLRRQKLNWILMELKAILSVHNNYGPTGI